MDIVPVIVSRRPSMWQNVVDNILRQRVRPSFAVLVTHGMLPVPEVFVDAMEDNKIEFIADVRSADVSLGAVYNYAISRAVSDLCKEALISIWGDDDYYGADFTEAMQRAFEIHPDAWLLGKSAFATRYVGGRKDGRVVLYEGRIKRADGHCGSFSGATLVFRSSLWEQYPTFRYPDSGVAQDDVFIQRVALTYFNSTGIESLPPFYHVENGEFYAQRYADPAHGHLWTDPRDSE